ncbi:MAG: aldo/keto reductase [Synergistaceae bacterium]|jgi:predicted aldo/keto reductase-like oxidoreductase|nr:aldo/keto reductase [Synergistaceae bacterium]
MEYRKFGKTDHKVSRFGLGCMRFPESEADAIKMVRHAIDNGVNYLDSAYIYGDSERITGRALQDGYRNRVYMATKCPVVHVSGHVDFERYLDEQLARLQTDYIDFYLLHNLNPDNWDKVKRYDGLAFLDKMVQKGKILHKGFSIHNTLPAFKEIVDAFDWEMAQIQLNILDEHSQIGIEGLRYAADKGIPVVIMEPLRGGYLPNNLPERAKELIANHPQKRSFVEWCFRWLYNKPEVAVVLSGTSTVEQLDDNLRIFDRSAPNVMSDADTALIEQIQGELETLMLNSIGCTGCRYCMPCSRNIAIPEVFRLYNNYKMTRPNPIDRVVYNQTYITGNIDASRCVSCGICQRHCPQNLKIMDLLRIVHNELADTV